MRQIGNTEAERRLFMNNMYRQAKDLLIHSWSTKPKASTAF